MNRIPPRVMIIGATGNLGTALCDQFQRNKWQVFGTSRSDQSRQRLSERGVDSFELDVTKPESIASFAAQAPSFDTIVLNAGILKALSKTDFLNTNALGPESVVNALSAVGKLPQRAILISSQLVGGANASEQNESERYTAGGLMITNPEKAHANMSDYARSKALGEKFVHDAYVEAFQNARGFISLRPSAILGAHDTVTTQPMISGLKGFLNLIGAYPNFSPDYRSMVSVIRDHDLARVVIHVAEENLVKPRHGIFDVENDERGLFDREIANAGQRALGTKLVLTPKLGFALDITALIENFLRRFGRASVLDRSRPSELRQGDFGTNNDRLKREFPYLDDVLANEPFQTIEEILKDSA